MLRQEEPGPVVVEVDVHRADEPQEPQEQPQPSNPSPHVSAAAPADPVEGRLLKIIVA